MSFKNDFPENARDNPKALLFYYYQRNDFLKAAILLARDPTLFHTLGCQTQKVLNADTYLRKEVREVFMRMNPDIMVYGAISLEHYSQPVK